MSDTASSSNNIEKKAEAAAAYVGPAPAAHSDEEKGPYRTVGDSGVIVSGDSGFALSVQETIKADALQWRRAKTRCTAR